MQIYFAMYAEYCKNQYRNIFPDATNMCNAYFGCFWNTKVKAEGQSAKADNPAQETLFYYTGLEKQGIMLPITV